MTDLAPAVPYQDRLSRLLGHLTNAALLCGTGQWTHAALIRQGYRVSLLLRDDRRRLVSIAREDRPEKGNLKAWERHHVQVNSVRQHMGIAGWEEVAPRDAIGPGTLAWFLEPTKVSV